MLAIAIIILAASVFVPVISTVVPRADVSTLAGPFTLVTTLSTTTPVVSTGNLVLYYPNFVAGSSPGLNLFSTSDLSGTKLQINSGVLGTLTRPDDVVGSLPYNATTPDAGGLITFSNQFAPHAGYVLSIAINLLGITYNTY